MRSGTAGHVRRFYADRLHSGLIELPQLESDKERSVGMNKRETFLEAVSIIQKSNDPGRAMMIAIDICTRLKDGESAASIALSYGASPERIKELEVMEA